MGKPGLIVKTDLGEICISSDVGYDPGVKLSVRTTDLEGNEKVLPMRIRWVVGDRLSSGELVRREIDTNGRTIETVLGSGDLKDYFVLPDKNAGGYLMCIEPRQPDH